MKKGKLFFSWGFTLVELLIVIALIGILSVAVLSTLNPIEQTNKASDAKYKNDAAEILGALERYYTTKQEHVWMDISFTDKEPSADAAKGFTAEDAGVGICKGALIQTPGDCTDDGILITNDEIKAAFRDKGFLSATTDISKIFVYKAAGASINVCFVPKARVSRTASSTNPLYLLTFAASSNHPTAMAKQTGNGTGACPLVTEAANWADITKACFMCVP